jgi:hypothetical protein
VEVNVKGRVSGLLRYRNHWLRSQDLNLKRFCEMSILENHVAARQGSGAARGLRVLPGTAFRRRRLFRADF